MKNKLTRFGIIAVCFALLGTVGFAVVLRRPLDWIHGYQTSLNEAFLGGLGLRFVGTCVALGLLASSYILNPKHEPLRLTCAFYLVLAFVYALVFSQPGSVEMLGVSFLFSMAAAAMASVLAMPMVYLTVVSARALAGVMRFCA